MDHSNLTFAKISILDTGKFEQWNFRIQQYLQNEHYALCEVIEFGDSYKAPPEETGKGPANESSARKKGRTVAITTKDMQKRRNNVKARTTLLLVLPDEHQLRFSKLQAIVSHLEFMDVKIEQDDLNKKFLTSLAPEWLISGKGEVHTASTQVSTASTDIAAASLSHDTICLPEFVDDTVTDYSRPTPSIDASKCNKSELQSSNFSTFEHEESTGSIMSKPMIKFVKEADCSRVIKINNTENARKSTMKYVEMYRNISKVKNQPRVLRVSTVTEKIPTVDSKFPSAKSTLTANLGNKGKGNPQNNINDKGYWDSGCSRHMTRNISYLSEYEPYDGGYVSFGHRGGKITGKGIIKTDFKLKDDTNVLLRTPKQHNMYYIDLNNIGNPQNNINDKGYWDNGCSRHMTGNISYLSEYEPYDGGYVSFGHRGERLLAKAL
nr:hypothetical protein [Tanacetum cinerariifolium]